MFVFFFCRPADAFLSSEPGGGQGNLATQTMAQDCMFCLIFFVMHVTLFSLCYTLSGRRFPLAGLWVVPPFHFVLIFAFCLAPPTATMVACGRVLTLVSFVLAPVFFSSSIFVSPPPPR